MCTLKHLSKLKVSIRVVMSNVPETLQVQLASFLGVQKEE